MKAPQKRTMVTSVMPGQAKARMPKRIATIPRKSTSHQYFASIGSIGAPIGAAAGEGAVDMSNLPFGLGLVSRTKHPLIISRFDCSRELPGESAQSRSPQD